MKKIANNPVENAGINALTYIQGSDEVVEHAINQITNIDLATIWSGAEALVIEGLRDADCPLDTEEMSDDEIFDAVAFGKTMIMIGFVGGCLHKQDQKGEKGD